MAVCLAICLYVRLPVLLSDSMQACLSALLPHYAFRDRGERGIEREREREKREREREGDNGLRLAVPCLAGSPYFSVVRVPALPPLGIVPMTVLHPGNPDEQKERGKWGLREGQREA